LNQIATSTDPARALSIAEQARRALADWPRTHFGYRQDDVRDYVMLIDGAIARLKGTAAPSGFELSFVATPAPVEIEPLAAMPPPREQLNQLLLVLKLTENPTDRVALLQSSLTLLAEARGAIDAATTASTRRSLERQLRQETEVDSRYSRVARDLLANAASAARQARVADVQRVLDRIDKEDVRLGRQRPQVVQALTTSVQAQLDRARQLRLLRDQWAIRRSLFRDYQRAIGNDMVALVKLQSSLEAIRKLEGPTPERLASLQARLRGGSARLQRLQVPGYLQPTHDLLVNAWRFAENAANSRYEAVSSGNLTTAWSASSAAAGSLMMLSRAQQEIRALLEPPQLPK
jgi:hypothetical protein